MGCKKHIPIALLICLFIIPIAIIVVGSVYNTINCSIGLKEYCSLISDIDFLRALTTSFIITTTGSIVATLLCFLTAYGLIYVKRQRIIIYFLILCTIAEPGVISYFLFYNRLGLINTYYVYFVDNGISAFYILLCMLYLHEQDIKKLREIAIIDGCGEWRFIITITFPICFDIMITVLLFFIFDFWSNYTTSLYYILDNEKITLSQYINILLQSANSRQIMGSVLTDNLYGYICAATVSYMLPVIFLVVLFKGKILSYIERYIKIQYLSS